MRGILLASCALTAVAAVVSRALRQPQVIAATCCAIAVSSHFLCLPHHQLAAAASVPTVVRTCGTFELHDLQFQGRGGTGTVYSATTAAATTTAAHGLVLKVSGPMTAQAVIHECDVLRTLEARGVRNGVEQCLATCPGPTSIVLAPFVPGATASLSDPRLSPAARVIAVRSLGTTVVDAVLAGVASSDLQVSKATQFTPPSMCFCLDCLPPRSHWSIRARGKHCSSTSPRRSCSPTPRLPRISRPKRPATSCPNTCPGWPRVQGTRR